MSYFALGRSEAGLKELTAASQIFAQVGHIPGVIDTALTIGRYHSSHGQRTLAYTHFVRALELATATGSEINMIHGHAHLAVWYEAQDHLAQALYHTKQRLALQAKHFELSKQNQADEFRIKHETKLREQESEIYRAQTAVLLEKQGQLENLIQERSDMLSIFAHDLRTPVTTAQLTAELLSKYWPRFSAEKRQKKLDDLSQNIQNIAEIASSLAQFGLMHVNQIEPSWRAVNLRAFLNREAYKFEGLALKKSLTLQIETNQVDAEVETDPVLLSRIISNLISNAVKYSPPETIIWVTSRFEADYFLIHIQDEGQGLTAEDRKQLFQKFRRLSARPTADETSTGLGLYIVKECVQLLGGEIAAESGGRDQGAVFTIRLPKVAQPTMSQL